MKPSKIGKSEFMQLPFKKDKNTNEKGKDGKPCGNNEKPCGNNEKPCKDDEPPCARFPPCLPEVPECKEEVPECKEEVPPCKEEVPPCKDDPCEKPKKVTCKHSGKKSGDDDKCEPPCAKFPPCVEPCPDEPPCAKFPPCVEPCPDEPPCAKFPPCEPCPEQPPCEEPCNNKVDAGNTKGNSNEGSSQKDVLKKKLHLLTDTAFKKFSSDKHLVDSDHHAHHHVHRVKSSTHPHSHPHVPHELHSRDSSANVAEGSPCDEDAGAGVNPSAEVPPTN